MIIVLGTGHCLQLGIRFYIGRSIARTFNSVRTHARGKRALFLHKVGQGALPHAQHPKAHLAAFGEQLHMKQYEYMLHDPSTSYTLIFA